jgi:hypothetical protein
MSRIITPHSFGLLLFHAKPLREIPLLYHHQSIKPAVFAAQKAVYSLHSSRIFAGLILKKLAWLTKAVVEIT